jgi:hypothetical protein
LLVDHGGFMALFRDELSAQHWSLLRRNLLT